MSMSGSYASCNDPNFLLDSYIPSINQSPTYVACNTPGNNAGNTQCAGKFSPKVSPCYGCMDISQIFAGNTTAATVTASIMSRYAGNAGCNTFASDMGNIWMNYYYKK